MSDNIKVVVKVRPLISREVEDKLSYRWRVKNNTLSQLDQNGRETDTCFTFDKVYDKDTKTEEVYNDIAKPIVEAAIDGFNGTIFAYGQTSSGKTYTMTGTEQSPGIIPLAVLNLFEIIKKKKDRDFLVRVSYIEIYNETLKDLLDVEKTKIKIHDTYRGGVKVDCSERVTGSPEEVLEAMREGEANRQTGATNMNEESSRSHSIFQITIESREHIDGEDEESGCVNVSQLNLVDLAGSERAGQTGATGIRFKEGTHINKSLSSLALVIKQLSEDPNKFANYRDSKLTRILQNSLGGNAKTSIVCAITPASVEETISTLQFANRAKSIKNKPEVNAVATNATMIQSLTKQLSKLQSELADKRNLEVMLESSKNVEQELQNRIANLQKLILNGFGQRSSMDFSERRKAVAPRRVTISTLHHADHDRELGLAAPAVPSFCTPGLKYNPLCTPGAVGVGVGAGCARLAPVAEEARAVTPPPARNHVTFHDEVIEITSDDDSMTETRCSPYHKCYGSSKTPPCILRKHAKQAEKNLQDIVELTEREKIYSPDVVELIEKLDQNACIISQLQEEISALKEMSKDKDSKIEELTIKVVSSEDTLSSVKSELDIKCKEKDTKLTDWEVSYETLTKKYKNREQELLSLLDEQQKSTKRESIGIPKKMESEMINFMNISKDITLVNNSDTDSSTHDDGSAQVHDLVANIQAELAAKSQTIIDLEANIYTHKEKIESLETSSQQLQTTIDELKNKLSNIESENSYLKCTVDNLNSTIESQKQNLKSAEKDIESYNSTIQELQIQLSKKENVPTVKLNDSTIEAMIANEQKCMANNENIKNIINSLKSVIENKNKEIDNLKAAIIEKKEISIDQEKLKEQLELKKNLISTLTEEAEKLKTQLNENMTMINKLIKVEQDLTNQLTTVQEENKLLQKQSLENTLKIENLEKVTSDSVTQIGNLKSNNESLARKITEKEMYEQHITTKNQELAKQIEEMTNIISNLEKNLKEKEVDNEQLTRTVNEKETREQNMSSINKELSNQVENMTQRIIDLESDLKQKDQAVTSSSDIYNEIQDSFAKAKMILFKVQNIAVKLKDSTENLPEPIDDLSRVLEIINNRLSNIDDSTTQSLQTISELEDQCSSLSSEKESEISLFKLELEQLNNELTAKTETLTQKTYNLIEELKTAHAKLQNKEEELAMLEKKVNNAVSTANNVERKSQENFTKTYGVLRKLHNIALKLNHGIDTLPDLTDNFDALFELFDINLNVLDTSVIQILNIAIDMQEKLVEFTNDKESEIANFESQIEKINSDMAIQTLKISQQTLQLIEELKKTRNELEVKDKQIADLEQELNDLQENNKNLRNGIISKDNSITSLHEKLTSLYAEIETLRNMNTSVDKLEETLKTKYAQIRHLEEQLKNGVDSLEDKYKDVTNGLGEAIEKRDMLLAEILKKAIRVARQCGIDANEIGENCDDDVYERVVLILDKIGMSVALLKTENDVERCDIEKMLIVAKEQIEKLTGINMKLSNDYEDLRNNNNELLLEIERTKKQNIELLSNSDVLEQLNSELHNKSSEIKLMEGKALELKEQFKTYEQNIQVQMTELVAENEELKKIQRRESRRKCSLSDFTEDSSLSKSCSDLDNNLASSNSPRSLVAICCNKIIDAIQHHSADVSATTSSMNTSSSKFSIQNESVQTQTAKCDCEDLSLKLNEKMKENAKLVEDLEVSTKENLEIIDLLKDLQATNDYLLKEREDVRKEIELLMEPAIELQKKITNHRTNLSTLTATTYAENKLLNSQLKVLKHHHTRYIHVCQRDLPAFKTQLSELMTILKESSFIDKQNTSFKRFSLPDVLDSSISPTNFKNESTLDGDLLMLDTNVTMTTADNTLVGPDQTCLEATQVNFDPNETASQANDISKIIDPCALYTQMETLTNDNQKLSEQIETLQQENCTLKQEIQTSVKPSSSYKDAQSSPVKINGVNDDVNKVSRVDSICEYCSEVKEELLRLEKTLTTELKQLTIELEEMKAEKDSIQEKYNNLTLEMPSTEALLRKLSNTEKECVTKLQEIDKLTNELKKKNKIIKELQNENDTLSVQVMDNITEADSLKKELDELKVANTELAEKIKNLDLLAEKHEIQLDSKKTCSLCAMKDEMIKSLQLEHSKISRSFSDSESSSRHNKICTLQNELHASKEDCKKITEEVATIKNHLDRSNVSVCQAMDLDESTPDSSIFTNSEDLETDDKNIRNSILANQIPNAYLSDKLECFNFYLEVIRPESETLDDNVKIIDIMKSFYKNLVSIHGNKIDNLLNQLNDIEESKSQLQMQLDGVSTEYSKVSKELHESQNNIKTVTSILDRVKDNIKIISEEMTNVMDVDKNSRFVTLFKENLLKVLDSEFGLTCVNIFETLMDSIFNKHKKDLSDVVGQYTKLQTHMESVATELNTVNENLTQMKAQLSDKENEYNLLKAQKEKVHEISNAVTMDIIKKEQELREMLEKGYKKLVELDLIVPYNTEPTIPLIEHLGVLFEQIVTKNQNKVSKPDNKTENLLLEINKLKTTIQEKDSIVSALQDKLSKSQKDLQNQKCLHDEIYENKVKENKTHVETIELLSKELASLKEEIQSQKILHEELHENKIKEIKTQGETIEKLCKEIAGLKDEMRNQKLIHENKVIENKTHMETIEILSKEIAGLKEELLEKENMAKLLTDSDKPNSSVKECDSCNDFLTKLECWKQDYDNLKTINDMITEEKVTYAADLEKARETIAKNKLELEKMTSDILVLRESVNDNVSIIQTLTLEAKSMMEQNVQLKKQLENKSVEVSRLEMNIKTHEKTAQIQTKMITRLQKQKEEDDKAAKEKDKQIKDLTEKVTAMQKECEIMKNDLKIARDEVDCLKNKKDSLEAKVSELEMDLMQDGHKRRQSIDAIAEASRRRRQSLHDTRRAFAEEFDAIKIEAVFEARGPPDDLFMDVDELGSGASGASGRSTPARRARDRDSLLARHDHDDGSSRPSSVAQARRRRQTIHDQLRTVTRHTHTPSPSSPHEMLKSFEHPNDDSNRMSSGDTNLMDVVQLRERLTTTQQELEELKEKYRELDDECETCAQYLRERDEQCRKLKKEKAVLEHQVAELNELLKYNPNRSEIKPSIAHAAVNTDEDWANLHSVVVDRMSFDAEVEKNKKLSRTIEELRCNKQELKNTVAKMQRALEKNSAYMHSKELESTKAELAASRQQLADLQERYRELDEECDTCAQYLRERDDQCRKLREAKHALEKKLEELQGDVGSMAAMARRKRQSAHDQNRSPPARRADAHTETSDDFLSYQVERDDNALRANNTQMQELQRVKMALERVVREKAALEQQLSAPVHVPAPAPAFLVATGSAIVQNQQLTDVMKENQKLKKMNAKLISICKKRGKPPLADQENEEPRAEPR